MEKIPPTFATDFLEIINKEFENSIIQFEILRWRDISLRNSAEYRPILKDNFFVDRRSKLNPTKLYWTKLKCFLIEHNIDVDDIEFIPKEFDGCFTVCLNRNKE